MTPKRRRSRTLSVAVAGLAISLGPTVYPVQAQGAWGAQLVGDRWSSPESGMNLGVGFRRMNFFSRYFGGAFGANIVPIHIDTPDQQNRATYFDLELGLLARAPELPLYAGWNIGYIYSAMTLEPGSVGPVDSGAQILKLGVWVGQDTFVEVQRWWGAEESTAAGQAKGDRWVVAFGTAPGLGS